MRNLVDGILGPPSKSNSMVQLETLNSLEDTNKGQKNIHTSIVQEMAVGSNGGDTARYPESSQQFELKDSR